MNREEMIRKVCEAIIKDCWRFSNGKQIWECNHCPAWGALKEKIPHSNDCPVLLAEKFLATPVIEVGDVVRTPFGCEGIVQSTGWVKLENDYDPMRADDLTLVRKRVK